jgi:anaerobic selenocysteine-containing dehydrogenase
VKRTKGVSRRDFFKTGVFLGSGLLTTSCSPRSVEGGSYDLAKPENILYSACLQCNTGCGIKVKIIDGVASKIDGSPYNPYNLVPHLQFGTDPKIVSKIDAPLCPKGQAGIQTAYDPYRLRTVIKRAGQRGENKWKTIPFDQAISEICEGGLLFKDVPGEEKRSVAGLKDICVLKDKDVMKEMGKAVSEIMQAKDADRKKELVAAFKIRFKDNLHALIDPDHPDLGPKNNQFVFMWGRLKGGRGDLIKRFASDALGSENAHGHTTVCQGSLYFSGKAMSEQWVYDAKDKKVKWTGGNKFYWQAELENARFVAFVGANIFDANYGPTNRMSRLMHSVSSGGLKYAIIDPRFSKGASKADRWIPVKPGEDGAFALGVIRWMIENNRINAAYLRNANKGAAKKNNEPNWTNASWLVRIDNDKPQAFLRGEEIGFPAARKQYTDKETGETTPYDYPLMVVMHGGKPAAFDPYKDDSAVEGDLFVDTVIKGVRVKSSLQIIKEEAFSKSLDEWARICGVSVDDIVYIARNLTSHGRRAVADLHRGVSQHTNGFYNVICWNTVNALIGNYDYRGGFIKASTYNYTGDKTVKVKTPAGKEEQKTEQPFNFKKMAPGKLSPFGVSVIRHGVKYEDSTLFAGYPAKRPWFPLASDIYQEIIPSIGDAYPYPAKALVLYMGNPVYALPAGHTTIEVLKDVAKLPLFITIDITVGETSLYADYIFPDLTYLERWEMQGSHPNMPFKVQPVRQPVIPPIPETAKIFGGEYPISLEAFILGIAEKMKLKGFGPDGFGKGVPFSHPDDYYLRAVANVAIEGLTDGKEVPSASDDEVKLFTECRRHLPKSVFDFERWRKAVGDDLIRKVVYVLNRGGRFEDYQKAWDGEQVKHKYGTLINLYQEKTAKVKNSMTGKSLKGYGQYLPPFRDVTDKPIDDEKEGYDLVLITSRTILHTKSRTATNYWLNAILPENYVYIHQKDAARLDLRDGDAVKVVSKSNLDGVWDIGPFRKPMTGKLKVGQAIRPGTISFFLGYGHWAYGANDIVIDGKKLRGDKRRGQGIHANAAMRVDPVLKNTPLEDVYGGSVVFYDSRVKLVKA